MRKHILILFTIFLTCYSTVSLKAQCNKGLFEEVQKISFKGKAPYPWAIDGKTTDWQTLLGPHTNDPKMPFTLPENTSFNWANDDDEDIAVSDTADAPPPEQDIRILSFIHDDYNVFFYFRRLKRGTSPNSFYYFCDVNADGFMNEGEPVFHAAFTANTISSLTLSRYIPDTAAIRTEFGEVEKIYSKGKGNPLGAIYKSGYQSIEVSGYPMPGKLEEVFNYNNIPFKYQLRENEIFSATLTESGYGVELAIPWRYLRYWLIDEKKQQWLKWKEDFENWFKNFWTNPWFDYWEDKIENRLNDKWENRKPLKPGDIFFYKLSMKQGGGKYRVSKVVDNVGNGNCCNGVGRSGNISFTKAISSPTVLIPNLAYRFKVTYTNRTNASEYFYVGNVNLNNIQLNFPQPSINEKTTIKVRVDKNCNGIIDPEDNAIELLPLEGDYDYNKWGSLQMESDDISLGVIAPPLGKACYLIDIILPPNFLIKSTDFEIGPSILSFLPLDFCDIGAGGKSINSIGVVNGSLGTAASALNKANGNKVDKNTNDTGVIVYPNPTTGTANVTLPRTDGTVSIELEDYTGRKLQQWNHFNFKALQINNLKPGLYLLKIQYHKTGKVETKKIVVQ